MGKRGKWRETSGMTNHLPHSSRFSRGKGIERTHAEKKDRQKWVSITERKKREKKGIGKEKQVKKGGRLVSLSCFKKLDLHHPAYSRQKRKVGLLLAIKGYGEPLRLSE